MNEWLGVVLAAGEGKRMKSKHPKVLHPLWGRPMIEYVLDACSKLRLLRTYLVIGHQADRVREALAHSRLTFIHQPEQKGTGHALLQLEPHLRESSGNLLVLSGDVPLITGDILKELVDAHRQQGTAATILSTYLADPTGYGRILRDQRGNLKRIVEETDANPQEKGIQEVNAGTYCLSLPGLFEALRKVGSSNRQGEYYLPDLFPLLQDKGLRVGICPTSRSERVMGINSREELARALHLLRKAKLEDLMSQGVTLLDPGSTFVDLPTQIGRDTVIYPHCTIEGETVIGEDCTLYPGSRIVESKIGSQVTILDHCLILQSEIRQGAKIGPFAHLRPQSQIGEGAKIGNFVEVKKSHIGEGSKVPHLSYIGDCRIGKKANIGAGSITCNYDGVEKHRTEIGDGVFAGSNTLFVAPVRVGEGAIIAAGSVVTQDVPAGSLAIARSRQINKEQWARVWKGKRANPAALQPGGKKRITEPPPKMKRKRGNSSTS